MIRLVAPFLACVLVSASSWAECTPDYRSDKHSGVFIADLAISGTTTMGSSELTAIRSKLIGACADEITDELETIIKIQFQNQGYFAVTVQNLDVKMLDPLVQPKQVALQAEVIEGQRYKLSQIKFTGNHVLTAEELRGKFSLRKGDLFKRSEIAGSFEGVRKLYGQHGYGDLTFVPETQLASGTVILTLNITEGSQYHMGQLKVFGKEEIADRLKGEWRLPEGAVFDFSYPTAYAEQNGFPTDDYIHLVRNCPKATVDVQLIRRNSRSR
jgi:hypothetical protein